MVLGVRVMLCNYHQHPSLDVSILQKLDPIKQQLPVLLVPHPWQPPFSFLPSESDDSKYLIKEESYSLFGDTHTFLKGKSRRVQNIYYLLLNASKTRSAPNTQFQTHEHATLL